jgi:hypothetical protein
MTQALYAHMNNKTIKIKKKRKTKIKLLKQQQQKRCRPQTSVPQK